MLQKIENKEVGTSRLAVLLGCSRQSIYRAEKTNRIQREPSGKWDPMRVQTDWLGRSRIRIDNPLLNTNSGGGRLAENPEPTEHPLLSAFAWTWCESLGALALLLRDKAEISSEKTIEILSLAFLLQWRIIGAPLNHGWEDPLRLDEPLIWLSTKEGKRELQDWLDAQPVCWDKKEPSRVRTVNAKQAAGFTS